jgi:putative PIN family toxin of toxin-antitoxin system
LARQVAVRVVLDTNVTLRAYVSSESKSGQILRACEERKIVALFSKPVIREYRLTLGHPDLLNRYPQLRARDFSTWIDRLRYVSDEIRSSGTKFEFARDPKDAKFLELCIDGRATHLVTTDLDLLEIACNNDEAAMRFRQQCPNVDILRPEQFTSRFKTELGFV